ncbi:MAG: DUF2332 family protein [Actinobacteria bacterium]|uniref:Unannotated protein n=1 Tax=freshwater metagenome TaxID=449393 RepID=A0A6J6VSS4_9ZZZZ|nr:DUF2332 family protein [Actinomycetota bacterium]
MSLFDGDEMLRALLQQAESCRSLGSAMYCDLFTDLGADYADGGRTYALLAGRSLRPVHDAVPLRLAGAIHRVVLQGKDDRLARHYPSVGGKPGEDFTADFIGYMRDHLEDVEAGLATQVQTNEVGRSVVHLMLSHWLTTLGIEQFTLLEIGASAGLNLNFDQFYACFGQLRMGDPTSSLRFMGDWFSNAPNVPRNGATATHKRGCDVSPIDVARPDDEARLLSFVWPDQRQRLERLRIAIAIAKTHRPAVDTASADEWILHQLARPSEHATLIFHSIVWQYLGTDTQNKLKHAIFNAGKSASSTAPIVWARMEPAGPVADIQVDVFDGSSSEPRHFRLAEIGYHGQNMNWL